MNKEKVVFIDTEVDEKKGVICDFGAVKENGNEFHSSSFVDFLDFIKDSKYIVGHNVLAHDYPYLRKRLAASKQILPYNYEAQFNSFVIIDTLYISALLSPREPHHFLKKEYKLNKDDNNNPCEDAKATHSLFFKNLTMFNNLDAQLKQLYYNLLYNTPEFYGFFYFVENITPLQNIQEAIHTYFWKRICENAPVLSIYGNYPIELTYALAFINVNDDNSDTYAWLSPWLLKRYPRIENIIRYLRGTRCQSCSFCDEVFNEIEALKNFYGHLEFRTFNNEELQREAVRAAIDGKSLLAIFPTGGGKSLTFQLPALMAGVNEAGLTIIISPLQSLMKDQIDSLEERGIDNAVTINSSLNPIERSVALKRIENGSANLLYIAPESLRSRTIEKLLLMRNVVRFVIDEAHCFSSWGHDFRVDYLYIADFIHSLQEKKATGNSIPVSCFTATAREEVIDDIIKYFQERLSLNLNIYKTNSRRSNLHYHSYNNNDELEKERKLRELLNDNICPTIIYVSRVKRTTRLANKLTDFGFPAIAYHGKMERQERLANQDSFMRGDVNIIVATTAFGMGVDKDNVSMVIHYDISSSLENYIQEAGRAGRDKNLKAECHILFSENDLNEHFTLLNRNKLSLNEINQIWSAIKKLTKSRTKITQSAFEIAHLAGWTETKSDIETQTRTAINALEQSGFVIRGQNSPRIYADSILSKNMIEANNRIARSARFDEKHIADANKIMTRLFTAKHSAVIQGNDGETRIDYLADQVGMSRERVVKIINLLREEKILANDMDLVASIKKNDKMTSNAIALLSKHGEIEKFLLQHLSDDEKTYNIKEISEEMSVSLKHKQKAASITQLHAVINYYASKQLIEKKHHYNRNHITIRPLLSLLEIESLRQKRLDISNVIVDYLCQKVRDKEELNDNIEVDIDFSVIELKEVYNHNLLSKQANSSEIEDALYYLLKIGVVKIEGGFLVIYNAMSIERKKELGEVYKITHYDKLRRHYASKQLQIHIVGEYASLLIHNYNDAMTFVDEYFTMDSKSFLNKYFQGKRQMEIKKSITPAKYSQLFDELSPSQRDIIDDDKSKYIVVAAGPGSGKTKLLTHKLAALYLMEDVKSEQMLMLTFSRAAVTEFKTRLKALIGDISYYIQITTFHSYCFDLLGEVGDEDKFDTIVYEAIEKIKSDEIDLQRITKSVLVIDEAQDMGEADYLLVKALLQKNENLRIIAVGDDDQSIYGFAGSDSRFFLDLMKIPGAKKYELVDNYRSCSNIVHFANSFVQTISHRFKETPIKSIKQESGELFVCKYTSRYIVTPTVHAVLTIRPKGRTCVVTRTNEEALSIVSLLRKEGLYAKLIQSKETFNLINLTEIRFIVDYLNNNDRTHSRIICDSSWKNAIDAMKERYFKSDNFPYIINLLDTFYDTHLINTHISDFTQFIRESKLEHFINEKEDVILVSTIHQTKGREFDNVIFSFTQHTHDEAMKRNIYVAITRAVKNLYVLTNASCFDHISIENITRYEDAKTYDAQACAYLQLGFEDVFLDYFANYQKIISTLVSGHKLFINENGCCLINTQIIRFSQKGLKKMDEMKMKGYSPKVAYIRHIVHWYGENVGEILVILPNIEFTKNT
ncbi:MAG: RecQ family ATP-dependent DNA helicase [Lachnospiraceae bacterium]|jgi:ATP-dependent DNA helicase RecQ|nr:RecQ family ATP-dependent DNA helicase [Lachnospiraceae bacterium]